MPKGAGPFPGLVLVHGSGPNNRDEELGPNKPFKDLAWGLATRGIAVLRYDKRSKVHGKKILADPKLEAAMTVKDETDRRRRGRGGAAAEGEGRRSASASSSSATAWAASSCRASPWPPSRSASPGSSRMAGLTRPARRHHPPPDGPISTALAGTACRTTDRKKLQDIKAAVAKIKALTDADRGSTVEAPGGHAGLLARPPRLRPGRAGQDGQAAACSSCRAAATTRSRRSTWRTGRRPWASRPDVEFQLYPKAQPPLLRGRGPPHAARVRPEARQRRRGGRGGHRRLHNGGHDGPISSTLLSPYRSP
ncbi:MAG: hypothetical protein MZV64_50040 [Ignavibacteriales bacterium]|nr:hypothetical protein [Ignavibacteriales bacterium]